MNPGMKIDGGFVVVLFLKVVVSYAWNSVLSSVMMIIDKTGDDEASNTVMAIL